MSLEDAMNNLAQAMNRYADVIETNGVAVVSQAKPSSKSSEDEEKTSSKAKATKTTSKASSKTVDKEEDDDGLGSDSGKGGKGGKAKKALTFDEVKAKVIEVKELGGREAAAEIFGAYGYSSLNNVQEKHYQDVYDDAQKYLDDNAE